MLDRQNQGPQCTTCGSPTKLMAIEPGGTGQDLRTFACPRCKRVQRHLIESAVTEAWLEPKLAIRARNGSAVTYEVRGGRMIPKQA
ncbi:hypothetical protein SAMN05444158_3443 [Bradyrhizobium canariense]|uniref:Uncharacterized protein n=1 Tax=Bradyrhizobium canariense TaxID=255045 RepID=A0A1H1VJB3_9BRAD|nr:hypothetical protein SAMN05444158_3443 [Bradyrhizobium canariense]